MNKVKYYRIIKKIELVDLAGKVGISKRYLQFIESGVKTPSLQVAKKIAICLNSTVDQIFFNDDGIN